MDAEFKYGGSSGYEWGQAKSRGMRWSAQYSEAPVRCGKVQRGCSGRSGALCGVPCVERQKCVVEG